VSNDLCSLLVSLMAVQRDVPFNNMIHKYSVESLDF
jgi:hypothetical protein